MNSFQLVVKVASSVSAHIPCLDVNNLVGIGVGDSDISAIRKGVEGSGEGVAHGCLGQQGKKQGILHGDDPATGVGNVNGMVLREVGREKAARFEGG